jgi:hypothetical protein
LPNKETYLQANKQANKEADYETDHEAHALSDGGAMPIRREREVHFDLLSMHSQMPLHQ